MTIIDPYEGRPVVQTPVSIRNAGDGLSKALAVEVRDLHIGETVHVVLECKVKGHDITPLEDKDPRSPLVRTQVLKAGRATLIDRESVQKALDDTQDRIDEASGNAHLPMGDES